MSQNFLLSLLALVLVQNNGQTILKDGSTLPTFKCPAKEHYIVLGNECKINAYEADNPPDTQYQWHVKDSSVFDIEDDQLFIGVQDEEELIIQNDNQLGEIHIQLIMEHDTRKKRRCDFKIIFFDTPYFGIDLGTTFSCIVYQLRGKDPKTDKRATNIVQADPNGQECIPTAIYFSKHNGHLLFGKQAMEMLPYDPENVIYDIKRIVGRSWADKQVAEFIKSHLFKIKQDSDNERKYKIVVPNRNIQISPEQALASIIIHLIEIATRKLGVAYNDKIQVVISIPAYFNNGQRRAVKSIAKIAKTHTKLLVIEPSAAAIAHTYYSSIPADYLKLFVIFDFGGGTLDCSVMKCYGMSCDVQAVSGNSTLGGIDFDRVITTMIIDKLKKDHGVSEKDIDHGVILKDAEKIKIGLTVNDVESYKYKNKPEIFITKHDFETHEQTQRLLSEAIKTLNKAIGASTKRFVASNIRMILMVGGTSNVPVVLDTLKATFEKNNIAERVKEDTVNQLKKIWTSIMESIWTGTDKETKTTNEKNNSIKVEFPKKDPQLMVITGSAVLAGALAFDTVDAGVEIDTNGAASHFTSTSVKIHDVIPLNLGFEVCMGGQCDKMSVMVEKNSKYPLQFNKSYCQHTTTDDSVTMDLYEGDSEFVSNNHYLSTLTVKNILKRKDMTTCNTFHIVFNIDEDGIAQIHGISHTADGSDGEIYTMEVAVLSKDGSLSDCEIKRMQNEMVSWFKSKKIQKLLQTTSCKSKSKSSKKKEHVLVKNYVYLDSSGSMMGDVGFNGGVKVFQQIGTSLLQQYTSITIFASKPNMIINNQFGKWKVNDINKQWVEGKNVGAGTYMWKMILDDVLDKHKNIKERARLTIITDGEDNWSPKPYNGLQGMDAMIDKFLRSKIKTNIEFNIVVLSSTPWKSERYRDFSHLTGGLFYTLPSDSASAMSRFKKEFADKYNEMDQEKIEDIRQANQQIFIKNTKNKPTELKQQHVQAFLNSVQ